MKQKYIILHTMEGCKNCKTVYSLLSKSKIPIYLIYDVQDPELLKEHPDAMSAPIVEKFEVSPAGIHQRVDLFYGVNNQKIKEWIA